MSLEPPTDRSGNGAGPVLQAYLLGTVDFEVALAFQRRLLYQVSGDRGMAALVLCEHAPLITIGRQGSSRQVLCGPEELQARRWRIRWVNRGGGCLLHLPGQLAIYPILALERLGLGLQEYLDRLQDVIRAVLDDFQIRAGSRPTEPGVWVGSRRIAGVGAAVRDWITYHGAVLNVNPDLEPFRLVRCGPGEEPMTSLERERRGPLRPALVRERLLEHFTARFPCSRTALFTDHPSLGRKVPTDALTASP